MGLSAEQFDKVMAALLGQSGLSERRQNGRVSISAAVLLTADIAAVDHPPIQALLTDLSRGGAGLTHHAGLPAGRRLMMHLPATGDEPVAVRCEVRHCDLIRESWFLIGVQFLD